MAVCKTCSSTILFGGKKEGGARFCNDDCLAKGRYLLIASQLPLAMVQKRAAEIHQGHCPQCNKKKGPVDIHTAYQVWSLIIFTSWKSKPRLSCRSCAVQSQLGHLVSSALFGWWGLPWGVLITPVQIIKNLIAIIKPPQAGQPSAQLVQAVRISMAQDAEPQVTD